MAELVSATEAARRLGVHPSQITRGIQKGIIPNRGAPGRPLVDIEEAAAARKANLDHAHRRGATGNVVAIDRSFQSARAKREQAAAEKAEIELKRLRGDTFDRIEVINGCYEIGHMMREALETRRAALAQRLSGLDAAAILAAIAEEDQRYLTSLADAIEDRLAHGEASEREKGDRVDDQTSDV